MFDLSQGVVDLTIKLFQSTQRAAIDCGSEEICASLMKEVFMKEFVHNHPMVLALATDDYAGEELQPISERDFFAHSLDFM